LLPLAKLVARGVLPPSVDGLPRGEEGPFALPVAEPFAGEDWKNRGDEASGALLCNCCLLLPRGVAFVEGLGLEAFEASERSCSSAPPMAGLDGTCEVRAALRLGVADAEVRCERLDVGEDILLRWRFGILEYDVALCWT
jgi:hypothetical protein